MSESCSLRPLVDRHFAGSIAPPQERELRAHLPGCDVCRERYERQLLLARLVPGAPSAEERLAHGLGLPARPRALWRSPALALGLAAAAAALLFFAIPRHEPEFHERGGQPLSSEQALYVYRVSEGELAFAYTNRHGWKRLMVYAVDEQRRVYWYHPAWTDPSATPVAIPIEAGTDRHELPEAIAQPLTGHRVSLHALFTDDPVDVRAIERGVRPAHAVEIVVPLEDVIKRAD